MTAVLCFRRRYFAPFLCIHADNRKPEAERAPDAFGSGGLRSRVSRNPAICPTEAKPYRSYFDGKTWGYGGEKMMGKAAAR